MEEIQFSFALKTKQNKQTNKQTKKTKQKKKKNGPLLPSPLPATPWNYEI